MFFPDYLLLLSSLLLVRLAPLATRIRRFRSVRYIADNNGSHSFFHRLNLYIAGSTARSKSFLIVSMQILIGSSSLLMSSITGFSKQRNMRQFLWQTTKKCPNQRRRYYDSSIKAGIWAKVDEIYEIYPLGGSERWQSKAS